MAIFIKHFGRSAHSNAGGTLYSVKSIKVNEDKLCCLRTKPIDMRWTRASLFWIERMTL